MDSKSVLQNQGNAYKRKSYHGAIKYEGDEIAQWHNPKLFINDILGENKTKQFTSILLIGGMGSGKSTLRRFISHELHTLDSSFRVFNLGKKELMHFDSFIDTLPNENLILNFEDVSLAFKTMKDPTQKNKILQAMTEARHPKFDANSERRIIVISEIHYVHATEKMHRSLGTWKFYTDLSTEELQNFNAMTKGRYSTKAEIFAKTVTEQFRRGEFEVSLTNKKRRKYVTGGLPKGKFRLIMCFDNVSLRFFLVPKKSCNYCSNVKGQMAKTHADPDEIIALAEKYYKKDGIAGLKQALLNSGRTHQYRNNTVYAYNTCKELLQSFEIDLDKLADRLRKRAQIPDKRLYTIKRKNTDFMKDLEDIREKIKSPIDPHHVPDVNLDLDL